MTHSLAQNTARTWQWMDEYEEARVNQCSFTVLLHVQLYCKANASAVTAPLANTWMQDSVGTELECNNTVLDLKPLVSTKSSV